MKKLTDDELVADDVTFEHLCSLELPKEVSDLLRGYIGWEHQGHYRYTVPQYLYDQITCAMENAKDKK